MNGEPVRVGMYAGIGRNLNRYLCDLGEVEEGQLPGVLDAARRFCDALAAHRIPHAISLQAFGRTLFNVEQTLFPARDILATPEPPKEVVIRIEQVPPPPPVQPIEKPKEERPKNYTSNVWRP